MRRNFFHKYMFFEEPVFFFFSIYYIVFQFFTFSTLFVTKIKKLDLDICKNLSLSFSKKKLLIIFMSLTSSKIDRFSIFQSSKGHICAIKTKIKNPAPTNGQASYEEHFCPKHALAEKSPQFVISILVKKILRQISLIKMSLRYIHF